MGDRLLEALLQQQGGMTGGFARRLTPEELGELVPYASPQIACQQLLDCSAADLTGYGRR